MNCFLQYENRWLRFSNPVEVLTARAPEEVVPCLQKMEASGLWAAGWISYEAAGAFDSALKTHATGGVPLLCFGLFETAEEIPAPVQAPSELHGYELGEWVPSVGRAEYAEAIASIKNHIAAGDTYQVNYTFRLNAGFSGSPFGLFCDLAAAQQGRYAAWIEHGDLAICSASPELFFELKNGRITARPMKGTRARGLTAAADRAAVAALRMSEKDRAENIMIVDMLRNDIGRIAVPGSVETLSRFDVEKYPTVWQMTSTVQGTFQPRMNANERENLKEVLKALFPCSSITGAPKAKTMEMIRSLEKGSRGVYTGAIGCIEPDGTAQFSVAIRTAVVDRRAGTVEYGVGGGIVWDSDAGSEYEEALSKAAILSKKTSEFQLLETMRYEDGKIFMLERHLRRLADSADYFDFQFHPDEIRRGLSRLRFDRPVKIRLLLNPDGTFELGSSDLPRTKGPVKLVLAKGPVNSGELFLYHKTTNRAVYERARAEVPHAEDVLLFNERGEVTESCIANVVVELDGRKVTPPVACGLLAGTFRGELLERGDIEERIVTIDDLSRADAVWLINSIRQWQPVFINL